MADITQFMSALTVGAVVQNVTGDLLSAASAGGYAAWVQSITGEVPSVTRMADGRVALSLSGEQNYAMQKWLDAQVSGAFKPAAQKPKVDFQMGAFLTPWAMKFFIPAGIGLFVAGWLAAYYFQR